MSYLRPIVTMLALLSPNIAAHPGHGEPVLLSGTVVAVESMRVQLDVLDRASFSRKRVWVLVDEQTAVRSGKARLRLADLRSGLEVECAAETALGPDDAPLLRGITFRIKPPK